MDLGKVGTAWKSKSKAKTGACWPSPPSLAFPFPFLLLFTSRTQRDGSRWPWSVALVGRRTGPKLGFGRWQQQPDGKGTFYHRPGCGTNLLPQ